MKDAISAHAEFAENVLPRLKRTYIKKCQEVEVRPARGYRTAMARLTLSAPVRSCGSGVQVRSCFSQRSDVAYVSP